MNTVLNTPTKIRYEIMRSMLGSLKNKTLLDVGAGSNPISKKISTKKTILADALNLKNIDIVIDLRKKLFPKKLLVDAIVCGELLEHLQNNFDVLLEFNRVLSKNGKLVLSVPNICSLKNRFKVLAGQLPEHCARPNLSVDFENHIVDFNKKELIRLLIAAGFEVLEVRGNGIVLHEKLIWPLVLTPSSFSDTIIIKAIKNEEK